MTEGLVSQIVIGDPVGFFKVEQIGKGGRKEAFDRNEYLEAVKKRLTSSPSILSTELGTSRQSVYRFMKRYPDVRAEAEELLKQIGEAESPALLQPPLLDLREDLGHLVGVCYR